MAEKEELAATATRKQCQTMEHSEGEYHHHEGEIESREKEGKSGHWEN